MRKVTITGASGFVGKNLVAKLKDSRGVEVAIFNSKRNSLFRPRTFRELIEGSSAIYHLAAVNDPKDPGILKTNILGTWGVLEAVRRYAPASKVVFVSSFAVYRTPLLGEVIDEKYATFTRNVYGFTKLVGEKLCFFYSKVFGMRVAIARISNIYGPGMPPFKHSVVSTFIERIRNGKSIEISGSGDQTRDFIYIGDVLDALIAMGDKDKPIGIFNICSGESISINNLVEIIEEKFKKKIKKIYKKEGDEGGYWRGDNRKASKELSWRPRHKFKL